MANCPIWITKNIPCSFFMCRYHPINNFGMLNISIGIFTEELNNEVFLSIIVFLTVSTFHKIILLNLAVQLLLHYAISLSQYYNIFHQFQLQSLSYYANRKQLELNHYPKMGLKQYLQ